MIIKFFKQLLFKKRSTAKKVEGSIPVIQPVVEHKTFTDTGEFIMAEQFEKIWVERNVKDNYRARDILNDDEYIDYHLWEDMNEHSLFKKYLPSTKVFIGKNPNVIFHGGCLGCLSQRLHGLSRCKGCMYFRANWSLMDLKIEGEEADRMPASELKKILGRNNRASGEGLN